ncbi:MAG TPA: hypothetical protein VMU95_16480 [Trebonia sp.]|nr:hypothetical protein [Trebonia sp.]
MTHGEELVLRTLVFQFDGRVVEVFGAQNYDAVRYHVALMKEPCIGEPNRNGRSQVTIGSASFSIGADEMELLKPLLARVTDAIRATRD